jgi:hypothetical protein
MVSDKIEMAKQALDEPSLRDILADRSQMAATIPQGPSEKDIYKATGVDPQAPRTRSRNEALRHLKIFGLGTVGLGASAALLSHLNKALTRKRLLARTAGDVPTITIPKVASTKEAKRTWTDIGSSVMESVIEPGVDRAKEIYGRGVQQTKPLHHAWYLPAMLGVGVGGGGLAYTAADKLLTSLGKSRRERKLRKAEDQFQQALSEQFDAAGLGKQSSIGAAVDGLAQSYASGELNEQLLTLHKAANPTQPVEPYAAPGTGFITGGAGLALALSALASIGGVAAGRALGKKFRPESARKFDALERALSRQARMTRKPIQAITAA